MSRTPKNSRLGVFVNQAATREQDRYYYDDPIASARWHFLDALLRLKPAIVEDLRRVARVDDDDDDAALTAWTKRWHLPDAWCRDYARATIALYRFNYTSPDTLCFNPDLGGCGEIVTDETSRAATRPTPLIKKPEHFGWMARYHLDPTFAGLGRHVGKKRAGLERAIKRLAAVIGLTLRPAPKGNPTIGLAGAAHAKRRLRARQQNRLLSDLGR